MTTSHNIGMCLRRRFHPLRPQSFASLTHPSFALIHLSMSSALSALTRRQLALTIRRCLPQLARPPHPPLMMPLCPWPLTAMMHPPRRWRRSLFARRRQRLVTLLAPRLCLARWQWQLRSRRSSHLPLVALRLVLLPLEAHALTAAATCCLMLLRPRLSRRLPRRVLLPALLRPRRFRRSLQRALRRL